MNKLTLVVMFLAALSASSAFKLLKVCSTEALDEGEEVENCGEGDTKITKNGSLEMTIVFENKTLEVFQYPNSSDCYIVRAVDFPNGFSGKLEKEQCDNEADKSLTEEVKKLSDHCTGKVHSLGDCPKETETQPARDRRGCYYRYICYYYWRVYWYFGQRRVRNYIICRWWLRC